MADPRLVELHDGINQVGTSTNPIASLNYSGLVPERYDEIALSYTDGNVTGVVYKLLSATVATLTLSYTDGNLTGVVRS